MSQISTSKIGPIVLPVGEANKVEEFRNTKVSNLIPRTISSDGSMDKADSHDIAMAFGVVDLSQNTPISVSGRTDGYASSTKAELMGLLAAIIAAPPAQDIKIELHNQAVVSLFR